MNLFHHSHGGDWEERSRRTAAADLPKPYKTLTETDLKNLQESDISTVSAALSVPRGLACSLLLTNRWDLHSACDKWLSAAAVTPPPPQGSTSKHVICNICFEKFRPSKMAAAACGHLFCLKCWSSYIGNSINDGATVLMLRCPESGCGAPVTFEMVERFAPVTKIKKYRRLLRRSYVELNPNRKWCPAPGCNLAIEFEFDGSTSREVVCACSHTFCFLCAVESHRPVSCKVAAAWLATNKSEAKSAAWIVSNTKPCPKCHRPIQKNQGCDHMICGAPCRFHFCWNCLSPMSNHDINCRSGAAEEKGKMKMPMSDAARYAHHCERWEFYENSGKAAVGDLQRTRALCGDGKLGFVAAAWEQIVACRRVLKWSCAFGYHVAEAALLEYLRGEAEAAVGMLQRCAEEAMGDEGVYADEEKLKGFEVRIYDLTRVMRRCFDTLVSASENWLTEVGSSKTTKLNKSSKTRPGNENLKGCIGSSKTSKPQRSGSGTRPGYESSKGDIGSSKTSKPQRSSGYKNSNRLMYFFSTSDSDSDSDCLTSDSDSLSSDSGSESEETKRRKYSTSELQKSRRHNTSSTQTGECSK